MAIRRGSLSLGQTLAQTIPQLSWDLEKISYPTSSLRELPNVGEATLLFQPNNPKINTLRESSWGLIGSSKMFLASSQVRTNQEPRDSPTIRLFLINSNDLWWYLINRAIHSKRGCVLTSKALSLQGEATLMNWTIANLSSCENNMPLGIGMVIAPERVREKRGVENERDDDLSPPYN